MMKLMIQNLKIILMRAGEFNNYELLIRWGACYTFS